MTEIINTPVSYFDNSGKFGLCLFAVSRSIRFLDFFTFTYSIRNLCSNGDGTYNDTRTESLNYDCCSIMIAIHSIACRRSTSFLSMNAAYSLDSIFNFLELY